MNTALKLAPVLVLLLLAPGFSAAQTLAVPGTNEIATLMEDIRVAKIDTFVRGAGAEARTNQVAVVMLLSSKRHFRLEEGQTFVLTPAVPLKLERIAPDDTVWLRDPLDTIWSVPPITETEKAAYEKRFFPHLRGPE